MNKQLVHEKVIQALEEACSAAIDAARQAHDTATNKESVAENKYDTFGLEASYLAHGQAKRVAEYEADLVAYKSLGIVDFSGDSSIELGSLIQLEDEEGVTQYLFLGPSAGGLKFDFEDKEIILITTLSPLGKALIGHYFGDEIEMNINGENIRYKIAGID